MKRFFEKIDMRSRTAMENYLGNHFRYDTMNSWNGSTSYANNLKINRLGLDGEVVDKLYEMIYVDGFYDGITNLISEFDESHKYLWQAGFNGRSNGYYLVLYKGGSNLSSYRSYCTCCGQKNFKLVPPDEEGMSEEEKKKYENNDYTSDNKCGKCGRLTRKNYTNIPMESFSYPGKSVDMNENYTEWSMDELKERIKLVQEFDKLCDEIVKEAIYVATNSEVEDEEILVSKTVRILVAI